MAQFQNMIITRAGLDMIAQSQAGGTLIFTKGKLGDGQIGDQSIPDLTDLINAKMSVELSSVTAKTEGHVEVRFIVDNTDLDVGFFVREVGIFAKVNEEGVEQLYGYANAGNYTNYLADKTVPIDSIITKIDLVVGNASNVAFTTDKSIVYVTLEDLEEAINAHNIDEDAHEAAFNKHNADPNAHADFIGATSSAAGKRGMVPAPAKGNNNRYLKSDATWGEIDTMQGATSSAAGSAGLVPAPAAGDQNKALFGDATYKQVVQSINGVVADSGGNVTVPTYTHPNSGVTAGTYRSVTVNAQGHVTAGSNPTITVAQGGTGATTAAQARTNLGITQANGNQIPTGTILPFAGETIPSGFLACNGAAVSRTTYAALFSAIGTTYGSGDGSTTFALPNLSSAKFVTSSTVSVKGSGKSLGLTNGTNTFGLYTTSDSFGRTANAYNVTVGSGTNAGSSMVTGRFAVGVTTTASESGLTGAVSLGQTVKFIIKY